MVTDWRLLWALTILFVAANMSACGFKLRGSASALESGKPVYVTANLSTRDLEQVLRARLQTIGGLTDDHDAANTRIDLVGEETDRKVIAVERASGRQEIQIRYVAVIELTNVGQATTSDQQVQLVRTITFSPVTVLGAETNEQELLRDLREQAADEIVRRIQYQDIQ